MVPINRLPQLPTKVLCTLRAPWAAAAALRVKGRRARHTWNCFPLGGLSAFALPSARTVQSVVQTVVPQKCYQVSAAPDEARPLAELRLRVTEGEAEPGFDQRSTSRFSCTHAANWLQVSYNNGCL